MAKRLARQRLLFIAVIFMAFGTAGLGMAYLSVSAKYHDLLFERTQYIESKLGLLNRLNDFQGRLKEMFKRLDGLEALENDFLHNGNERKGPDSSLLSLPPLSFMTALESALHDDQRDLELVQSTLSYLEVSDLFQNLPSLWPVRGSIGSSFGPRIHPSTGREDFHNGVDIVSPRGTPVTCSAKGRVIFTGWKNLLGNTIVVAHGKRLETWYGHLSEFLVRKGQTVKKGQTLGLVGNTGRTTGYHLHYEVHAAGKARDPMKFLF